MTVLKPLTTFYGTDNFGIPRGTPGRNSQAIVGIVIHTMRRTLEEMDSQVSDDEYRSTAHSRHSSLHYGIDYTGNIHQWVNDADTAWGIDDYRFDQQPTAPPAGNPLWSLMATYPGVPVDRYVIHIGLTAGEDFDPDLDPFPVAMRASLVRLLCWLSRQYTIPLTTQYVATHNMIDGSMVGTCVESYFDLAGVVASAAAWCAADGEPDYPPFDLCQFGVAINRFPPVNPLSQLIGLDANGCLRRGGASLLDVRCQAVGSATSGNIMAKDTVSVCDIVITNPNAAPYVARSISANAPASPSVGQWRNKYNYVLTVCQPGGGDADYTTLQAAINAIVSSGIAIGEASRILIRVFGRSVEAAARITNLPSFADIHFEQGGSIAFTTGGGLDIITSNHFITAVDPHSTHIFKSMATSGADVTALNISEANVGLFNIRVENFSEFAAANNHGLSITGDFVNATNCWARAGNGTNECHGIYIANFTRVTLTHCVGNGSSALNSSGIAIATGNVTLDNCVGQAGISSGISCGIRVYSASTVTMTNCSGYGGTGGTGGTGNDGCAGIRLRDASLARLTNCFARGGSGVNAMGIAIVAGVDQSYYEINNCAAVGLNGANSNGIGLFGANNYTRINGGEFVGGNGDNCNGIAVSDTNAFANSATFFGGIGAANSNCHGMSLARTASGDGQFNRCTFVGNNGGFRWGYHRNSPQIGTGNTNHGVLLNNTIFGASEFAFNDCKFMSGISPTSHGFVGFNTNQTNFYNCHAIGQGSDGQSHGFALGVASYLVGCTGEAARAGGHGMLVNSSELVRLSRCTLIAGYTNGSAGLRVSASAGIRCHQSDFRFDPYTLTGVGVQIDAVAGPTDFRNCSFLATSGRAIYLVAGAESSGNLHEFHGGTAVIDLAIGTARTIYADNAWNNAPVFNMVLRGAVTNVTPLAGTPLGTNILA